jgi:hypothetical protein
MPRRAASGSSPDWAQLYELAAAQAGHFTAADAAEASFSLPMLQHHLKAHRLERAARGVFRLVQFPPTDEEWLVPAWLWSGREGTFSPCSGFHAKGKRSCPKGFIGRRACSRTPTMRKRSVATREAGSRSWAVVGVCP